MIDPTKFVKLHNDVWASPVWMGTRSPYAWRVYCWMLDKVTEERTVNKVAYGLVLGKAPISYDSIAKELGCSWRTIQRDVVWLRKKKLVHATRAGAGERYRYTIPNSRKFNNGEAQSPPEPSSGKIPDEHDEEAFRPQPKEDARNWDLSGLED